MMGIPNDRMGVFVSLPRNDPRLAVAAKRAGADGLKVHINTQHRASGTVFGSLGAEQRALEAILDVGLPTGLVAGGPNSVHLDEIRQAASMGFSYVDVYSHAAPADYVGACRPALPVVALGPGDEAAVATALAAAGVVAFELSTLDPALYGSPLSLGTLARIHTTRSALGADVPLVFPTQHLITPDELPLLSDAGVSAVLLGAVVFGGESSSLEHVVSQFAGSVAQ